MRCDNDPTSCLDWTFRHDADSSRVGFPAADDANDVPGTAPFGQELDQEGEHAVFPDNWETGRIEQLGRPALIYSWTVGISR